mmetsp:Transcript_11090/g.27282  ORF Transcript_11090/g.27282 Transcript_11090/m.27282 type:complete len:533 (-) Transcript_11090:257-1855(-)
MMAKFFYAALAGNALITGCAATAVKLGKNKRRNVQRGEPTMEALLQKARPYGKKGARRRLDQGFQVDGTYNIKFSQCVDVKLYDEDLFDEEVVEYTKSGQIISAKSFAIFHVCQEDDCYYESEDDLYIVDLATYVQNVASYHANAKASYCTACDTYYDNYCTAQDDAYDADAYNDDAGGNDGDDAVAANDGDDAAAADEAQDDAASYYAGDDVARRLAKNKQRRTTSYIDCDQCKANGCLDKGNDDGQQQEDDGDDTVAELIEDISQCLNTGLNWNDDDLYLGFMCSPYDGDGVELAVFLDNQCTVYTSLKSFSDIPTWYIYSDEDVFTEAETYIKNAFTDTMPCLYEEFGDPAYQPGDDDAAAAANDDGYQVNDYCTGIFEEGPIAFNSCAQSDDQNNGNENYNQNEVDDQIKFYDYDMNYDDVRDLEVVCSVLQNMDGEYYYHYDDENSGTWNDHSGWAGFKKKKSNKGRWGYLNGGSLEGFSTSSIAIFLYVLLGVSMVISILFVIGVHEKKKREKLQCEPVYRGGKLV